MMTRRIALAVIAALYVALAAVYAWTTPLFEAPDETWHFWYVKHLADGGGLAVGDPDVRAPWRQEGTQPPLYYLMAAGVIRGIDTSDAPALIVNNPHSIVGRADMPGNHNAVVPVPRDPLQGTARAAQTARLLSVALGLITVLAAYGLGRETFPDNSLVALGTAGVVAFNPQFLFLSGSINNDNLIIATATVGLWLLVRWLRRPPSWLGLTLLGVVGGVAALSKLSGLALIAFIVLCVSLRALHRRAWRDLLLWNALLVGLPLLIAGWFYWRNFQLYGDPLAIQVHLDLSGRRNPRPSLAQLWTELESVRRSFWGVFGWFNVVGPEWLAWLYDALSVVALVGVIVGVWRAWRGDKGVLPWVALLVAWSGLIFVSLLRWMSLIKSAQGRLLFPALAVLAVLGVWGLTQLAPRWQRLTVGAVVAGMALAAAAIPPLVIAPAYAPPPRLDPATVDIPNRLDIDFGGQLRLLGYEIASETTPGGLAPLTLYWQALKPMDTNYSVFAQLVDEKGQRVAGLDTYPGLGSYPTQRWEVGPVVKDSLYIPVGAKVDAPRSFGIVVGVADRARNTRLPATRDGQPAGDTAALGSLFVRPTDSAWQPPNPTGAVFGDVAELAGYELSATAARPGDPLTLTLYWRARQPLPADYTVFVHLGDGEPLAAQADGPPLSGLAPTSRWQPGQLIRETRAFQVRPDTAVGAYPLRLGLYLPSSGERLPLTAGGAGDAVEVGNVTMGR